MIDGSDTDRTVKDRLVKRTQVSYLRKAMRSAQWLVVSALSVTMACGSEVVVQPGAGGSTTNAAGPGGAGGAGTGGSPLVCGDACIACCNDDNCPLEAPELLTPCEIGTKQPICGYVEDGGCIYRYLCDGGQHHWGMSLEPVECPGACPDRGVSDGFVCLEVGRQCQFFLGMCWLATCGDNHRWAVEYVGETCPE
jgi:hypothetical protein